MRVRRLIGPICVVAGSLSLIPVGAAHAAPVEMTASLTGAAEVSPNVGDPDGSGSASVTVDSVTNQVCWNISYAAIDTPTVAHIHVGAAGTNGGVVVNFTPSLTGSSPFAGCTTVTNTLATQILANPAGYYVNVHTSPHPGGAVRGQLGNTVPVEVPEVPWGPLLPVSAVAVGALLIIVQRNRRLPRALGS